MKPIQLSLHKMDESFLYLEFRIQLSMFRTVSVFIIQYDIV